MTNPGLFIVKSAPRQIVPAHDRLSNSAFFQSLVRKFIAELLEAQSFTDISSLLARFVVAVKTAEQLADLMKGGQA